MKNKKPHTNNFFIYWVLALALVFVLGSCHTEQRSMRKAQQFLFNHPEFSAGYCAEQYPVKDSIVTRDSIQYDTLYVPAETSEETAPMNPGDNEPPFEVVPNKEVITKYIIKTIRKDSIIYRRDVAEERRLNLSLQACQGNNNNLVNKNDILQKQLNEWKGKAKTRWWWILALLGAAAAYTVIKLKSNILSIKNKLS